MSDDLKHQVERSEEAKGIQEDLSKNGLSRRALLDRLKGLGVGFGAAFVLGAKAAEASETIDKSAGIGPASAANLSSTNPVLNDIIQEGRADSETSKIPADTEAFYARIYRRGYFRGYRRGYFRGYRRFYARF